MIKVWYGDKGIGKTKALVKTANEMAVEGSKGHVVFINHKQELMYELKYQIRFIKASEYPIASCSSFIGFICGLISSNYDIEAIFIDGLTHITRFDEENYKKFFETIKVLSEKYEIDFYVSMSGEECELPEYVKPYIA